MSCSEPGLICVPFSSTITEASTPVPMVWMASMQVGLQSEIARPVGVEPGTGADAESRAEIAPALSER